MRTRAWFGLTIGSGIPELQRSLLEVKEHADDAKPYHYTFTVNVFFSNGVPSFVHDAELNRRSIIQYFIDSATK